MVVQALMKKSVKMISHIRLIILYSAFNGDYL